jgi:hypothetical protein
MYGTGKSVANRRIISCCDVVGLIILTAEQQKSGEKKK